MQLTGYLSPCVPSKELPFIVLILFFSKTFSLKKQWEPLQQVYWDPFRVVTFLSIAEKNKIFHPALIFIWIFVFFFAFRCKSCYNDRVTKGKKYSRHPTCTSVINIVCISCAICQFTGFLQCRAIFRPSWLEYWHVFSGLQYRGRLWGCFGCFRPMED